MAGFEEIGPARALALAAVTTALGACASTPASLTSAPTGPGAGAPDAAARVTDYAAGLQCVPFARQASGIQIYGDAYTWWTQAAGRYPRSGSPAPGSVLAIRGYHTARRGHVAVVRRVESSRLILVDHANWLNGGEISVNVPVLDVSAANDWSEIKVWHIPGGHWGGRTYRADGFIHPFALHAAMS